MANVTVLVLILGMPSLRSTRLSDLHDCQVDDAGTRSSRMMTQVQGH